jgi:hypothetical protein
VQRRPPAEQGEAGSLAAERDRFRGDSVEQGTVERLTQRHDHRAAKGVAGRELGALEHRAIHPADLTASRLESPCDHGVGDPKLTQSGDGVRREGKTEPELARRRRALEDADLPPDLPQGDAGSEAADASADDERGAHATLKDRNLESDYAPV